MTDNVEEWEEIYYCKICQNVFQFEQIKLASNDDRLCPRCNCILRYFQKNDETNGCYNPEAFLWLKIGYELSISSQNKLGEL